VAGSLGSLVPTLGFVPMLYANSTPFSGFLSFTQRIQGSLPGLHSGNGKYAPLVSRRLRIDTTSFAGNTGSRSPDALAIDKLSRTKREATLMLSRESSNADSVHHPLRNSDYALPFGWFLSRHSFR